MTNKPPFNGERVRLGNVCKIDNGYAFNSKLFNNNHQGMPLIRIRDIKIGSTSTYTTENYSKEYVVKNGDLLIGMDGEFNITEWSSGDALLNQRVCKISSTSERLSNRFLRFLLPPILKEIEDRTPLVTVKHLSTKTLQKTEVILPEIDKQNRIADIFGTVVSIIVYKKHQLDLIDQLVKSLFIEMFGDPVLNTKNWPHEEFRNNVELINGRAYKQSELLHKGKYKVLRVGNFFSNSSWYYSDLELEEKKYCDKGDLLYAWSASFGPRIWNETKTIFHYHIWKIEVKDHVYDKRFLCYLLKYAEQSFIRDVHGIGMFHLTKAAMEQTRFIVPPLSLQREFADFVVQVDKLQFVVQQQIEKLQTLYDSLAQEYFG